MNYYYILILLVELYSLILYPTWYAPTDNNSIKIILFLIFYISIIINSYIINKITFSKVESNSSPNFIFSKKLLFIILVYICGLLPFINFPILSKLDSSFHTGFPAGAVNKINNIFISKLHFNYPIIFYWVLFLFLILLFIKLKKYILRVKINVLNIVIVLFPFFLCYCLLLTYKINLSSLEKVALFHRYPPLGKTLFATFYLLFGINEFSGRVSQILLNILTVLFIYRIKFKSENKHINLLIIIIFLFNPQIWNIYFYNYLDIGTIFFAIAILFYFNEFYIFKDRKNLLLFWLFFITGLMYKRLIVFTFPTIFLFYLINLYKAPDKKYLIKEFFETISVPLIFFLPYFIYDKLFGFSPSSIIIDHFVHIFRSVFLELFILPVHIGIFLSLIIIISIFYSLKYLNNTFIKLSYIYFSVWILMISLTGAWTYVRHILPIFVFLAIFSGYFIYDFFKKYKFICIITIIIISVESMYLNFYSDDIQLINFNTKKYYYSPFNELTLYIKKNKLYRYKIYAPNVCEPIQFYCYKNNVPMDNLERKLWVDYKNQNIDSFLSYIYNNKFNYIVIPSLSKNRKTRLNYYLNIFDGCGITNNGNAGAGNDWDGFIQDDFHKNIIQNYNKYGFSLIKQFNYGDNSLYLLSINLAQVYQFSSKNKKNGPFLEE